MSPMEKEKFKVDSFEKDEKNQKWSAEEENFAEAFARLLIAQITHEEKAKNKQKNNGNSNHQRKIK